MIQRFNLGSEAARSHFDKNDLPPHQRQREQTQDCSCIMWANLTSRDTFHMWLSEGFSCHVALEWIYQTQGNLQRRLWSRQTVSTSNLRIQLQFFYASLKGLFSVTSQPFDWHYVPTSSSLHCNLYFKSRQLSGGMLVQFWDYEDKVCYFTA